jgi:hypothetical protein
MPRLSRIKDALGRLGGKDPGNAPASVAQTATIEGEATIIADTTGTFSELTSDQIMARNRAILAKVSHNPPFHKRFMEGAKNVWRIVGPIAFIVCTVGEVYYYIKHFLPADNSFWTQALLWGISLLIEIPFCMATFDLSGRKERAVEAKSAGYEVPDKDTPGAIAMWVAMALINIAGQVAFLVFITKVGNYTRDWPVYWFIAFRVVGVIIGDAYVAFFLSPAPTTIDHVVKHQKSQTEGLDRLNDSSINQRVKESRAQMLLEQNQRTIDTERKNADFVARFNDMHAEQMLKQQANLLELKAPEKKGDI